MITFSNYVNAELRVDETLITDIRIARKKKKSYAEAVRYDNTLTCANTTYFSLDTDIVNLSVDYWCCELLACEKNNFSNSGTCPPNLCTNSAEFSNSLNSQISSNDTSVFSSQDSNDFLFCRIYSRIRHLKQTVEASVLVGISAQTLFLIYVRRFWQIEKGLDFAPIHNKIN